MLSYAKFGCLIGVEVFDGFSLETPVPLFVIAKVDTFFLDLLPILLVSRPFSVGA